MLDSRIMYATVVGDANLTGQVGRDSVSVHQIGIELTASERGVPALLGRSAFPQDCFDVLYRPALANWQNPHAALIRRAD
jgi:hypothetical protein